MKIDEVKNKTDHELEVALETMKRELFDIRFNASTGTESNTSRINLLRRSVARVKTVLHERQLGVRGQRVQN